MSLSPLFPILHPTVDSKVKGDRGINQRKGEGERGLCYTKALAMKDYARIYPSKNVYVVSKPLLPLVDSYIVDSHISYTFCSPFITLIKGAAAVCLTRNSNSLSSGP